MLCALRSLSNVVEDWPDAGTNCRSSVQIRQAPGGASEGGDRVPQVVQMKTGMWAGYTSPFAASIGSEWLPSPLLAERQYDLQAMRLSVGLGAGANLLEVVPDYPDHAQSM